MTLAQLSFVEFSMVCPKVIPSILTRVKNSIPNKVVGALHLPIPSALNFFGFRMSLLFVHAAAWL
jgi:hypothetical protein